NTEMAFITLDDGTGKIEGVVFPKTYAASRDLWVKDKVVVVDGKLERKDEGLTIIVDSVSSILALDENSEFDFAIRIPKKTKPASLIAINQLLKENQGKKMGVLLFEGNGIGTSRKLILPFGVNYTRELEKLIQELINTE
ncbi:MAG: OB-fold nucleic acid binding domain-containing protein, partial [bacterium]|nr:OB-fold nucleic acid binding domain-containing protein [bacterium]